MSAHVHALWLPALALLASACAISRPAFVEPAWGDAPPPYPSEVTEITSEHRVCDKDRCHFERYLFRRDGRAEHTYSTGDRPDSAYFGRIDSLTFVKLANSVRGPLFGDRYESENHEPLAEDSYLFSVASLCRRHVVAIGKFGWQADTGPSVMRDIILTSGLVNWHRCCFAALR
jgi:hypothetical protein